MRKVFAYAGVSALLIQLATSNGLCADDADKLRMLRKEKLVVAEQRYAVMQIGLEDDGRFQYRSFAASLDWLHAALEVATNNSQRVAALEAHRERIRPLLKKTEALFSASARGGETEKLESARYWLLQADLWILEAKK
jgi:hypothetical protein